MATPAGFTRSRVPLRATTLTHSGVVSTTARKYASSTGLLDWFSVMVILEYCDRMVRPSISARFQWQASFCRIWAMRNTLVDLYEDIPRSVVVTANDYAAGLTFPMHAHRRGQF